LVLCPSSFSKSRARQMVGVGSFDLGRPALTPWIYLTGNTNPYTLAAGNSYPTGNAFGPSTNFPATPPASPNDGEFGTDWRGINYLAGNGTATPPIPPLDLNS